NAGQSTAPNMVYASPPNFPSNYFVQKPQLTPFTYTTSACQYAAFSSPPTPTILTSCVASFSLLGTMWDFGDVASGANNTSTQANPTHFYTSIGTYTAKLIYYYSCGGGTDTLKQVINITQPCASVST